MMFMIYVVCIVVVISRVMGSVEVARIADTVGAVRTAGTCATVQGTVE